MVFGRDLDKVIRCLGNEFYNEFYGWNDERNCNCEKKIKLDNDVNVVYIKNREGKMMTLKRYRLADGTMKVELIIEGKNINYYNLICSDGTVIFDKNNKILFQEVIKKETIQILKNLL